MTLLKLTNLLLFQWFFVRLARKIDDSGKQVGWTWLVGVVQMTGWGQTTQNKAEGNEQIL